MKTQLGKNVWLVIMGTILFALSGCAASENKPVNPEESKFLHYIPDIFSQLFRWPSNQVIEAKSVAADSPEVAVPKAQSDQWLQRVIAPLWLPDKEAVVVFIQNEFDDCDVIHYRWVKNQYTIEVSQTASIFAMTVTAQAPDSMGKDNKEKLNAARELCLQMFVKQWRRYDDQGGSIVVSDLAEKIVSYSFRENTVQHLQGSNGVLVGRPRTMKEEVIDEGRNDDRSRSWDMTVDAWRYWFRMVEWRTDGKSLSIFFPKLEGRNSRSDVGVGTSGYGGYFDKRWFRLPQTRSKGTPPHR